MNKTDKNKRLLPAAKRALLGGGVSLLALAIGAHAAVAQTGDAEEIVVTGIRKSIQDSLQTKRDSDDVIEAISAEDIGKLPDESIADSIARLPGLATQRNNSGRDQFISVRGLPADMSVTLLNGREQASTSNNRDVQYDQYPAELVNQVLVYKTGDAALVNAGISTIDIRTVRPLDYGKTALSVSARGQYDLNGQLVQGSSALGERVNIMYIDQFAHDTLGILAGYAHTDSPNQIVSQQGYGYSGNSLFPGGLQDWLVGDNLQRDGYTVSLQWKPNDRFEASIDEFYSRYNDQTRYVGLENSGLPTPLAATATSETLVFNPQIQNYDYHEKDDLDSFGANFKYKIADGWRTSLDLNFNDAMRKLPELELYSGLPINGNVEPTVTLTRNSAGFFTGSGQSYSNPSLYALGENLGWANFYPKSASWGNATGNFNAAGSGVFKNITTKDTIQEAKWNMVHDLSNLPFTNIEIGFDYKQRKKSYNYLEAQGYLNSLNPQMEVPSSLLESPTNFSRFGFGDVMTFDPVKAWTSGLYTSYPRQDIAYKNWFVHERVETGYLKSDIATSLFGLDVHGNVGTQVVHTNQSVLEFAENGSWPNYNFVPTSDGTSYWDVLPSMNLIFDVTSSDEVRFGVGRSMARPRLDTLAGPYTVTYTPSNAASSLSPWSASAGNPKLKPYLSDDVDLSYTKYLGDGAYASIAGYYKNLESFIYDGVNIISFAGFPTYGTTPNTFLGASSSYQNGKGGSIYGAEISGNLPFDKIAPWLTGFGLQANAAVNFSSITVPPGTNVGGQPYSPNGQIPELSKWTAGATLYYTYKGFEARVNDRYRSSYIHEVPQYGGDLVNVVGASENIVDMQISYSWDEGTYKGLTTSFSVQNATDEPQKTYFNNNPAQAQYFKYFGTSIMWGVSYKM
jgi:iron complex outermembrane receptor protein